MHFLRAIAGFFLFFELPVPLYWLILHPFSSFWRSRVRAAFPIAAISAWTAGGTALWIFRSRLISPASRSLPFVVAGTALLVVDVYIFWRVERELGSRRLVGHAELTGTGEMFTGGLYARARYPRYAGMFSAVLGAVLIAGTPLLWAVVAIWWVFALLVIRLEERELAVRFGAAYAAYRDRVPGFLPFRSRQ